MNENKNTFLICKKINYSTENKETQNKVDKACSQIKTAMKAMGFIEVSNPDKYQNIDYIFSVGGDGTMMHSLHNYIHNYSEVIGINAGNLGFLTPYSLEQVADLSLFDDIANGNYRKEKRSILYNEILLDKKEDNSFSEVFDTGYAVNEYAITANGPNDVLEFSIVVEKGGVISDVGYYKANAVLIVGPCGSTAYNMNTGGAIIDPSMRCMQITMVAPQTMGIRPVIIGPNSKIKVKVPVGAKVFSDGMEEHVVQERTVFSVSLMSDDVAIVLPKDWNFFDTLAKKLHWNNGKLN